MHYYNKNIADFNNATRHLTRQERSIYSDLLELQYDIETPLPNDLDWICKRVLAISPSERTDVEQMLNEFFDETDEGWSNARCELEISKYRDKAEKAYKAGKASGKARRRNKKPNKNNNIKDDTNGCSSGVEPTNNHKPITNNHLLGKIAEIEGLNLEAVTEWLEYRKERKLAVYKSTRVFTHLAKFPMEVQAEAVDVAIRLNYQGVFPEKVKHAKNPNTNSQPTDGDHFTQAKRDFLKRFDPDDTF